eukprot:TRINITY_DN6617_c0_g1_i1.p1 TRINITY_DN6617_c0_g1~~TRINITY_DN6617_c0_g1_i1.p1  ORF type:complete len:834 (+),score=347.14 TRINITY_DN6617_c0_g1_i1:69-2504(+)
MAEVAALQQQLKDEEARRAAIQKALAKKQEQERKAKLKQAERKTLTEAERAELRQVFDEFDKDKSGSIEGKELGQMSARMGCELSEAEIAQTIKQLDIDADGKLSFDEFAGWWGGNKKLGGNKGVKLNLMKAKLRAQMARDAAMERLKAVQPTDLSVSSRCIGTTAEVTVGGSSHFKSGLRVDLTILPLQRAMFEAEAEKLIGQLKEGGHFKCHDEFMKKPKGDDDTGPICGVTKLTFKATDDAGEDKVKEAVARYMKAREKHFPLDEDEEDRLRHRPAPPCYVTNQDGQLQVHFLIMIRNEGPMEELNEGLSKVLGGDGEGAPVDVSHKIFESVAVTVDSEVNPAQWFRDEGARLPDLFRRMRLVSQVKATRSVLEIMQKAVMAKEMPGSGYRSRTRFAKAAAAMLMTSMVGNSRVKIRLASPALAMARVASGCSALHRQRVGKAVESGELKSTPEIEAALAQGSLEAAWLDCVGENLGPTSAQIVNMLKKQIGKEASRSRQEQMYNDLISPLAAVLSCPTQVQILSTVACATLHLKGGEFLRDFVPADSAQAKEWFEAAQAKADELEERSERIQEMWTECVMKSKLDELKSPSESPYRPTSLGPRQLVFAGLPGCGKTSLIHMLRTGLPPKETTPTTSFSCYQLQRNRRLPYSQTFTTLEIWGADKEFEGIPDYMFEYDTAKALVYVVDTSKTVDVDREKAALAKVAEKLELEDTATDLIVVVGGKSDAGQTIPPDELCKKIVPEELAARACSCAANARDVDAAEEIVKVVMQAENKLKIQGMDDDSGSECGGDESSTMGGDDDMSTES